MTPNRAMLIAARSSQDFDYCLRATASARSKYFPLRSIRLRRQQRDLRLGPPFPGFFHRSHRFANAAPSLIKLAELRVGPRQI